MFAAARTRARLIDVAVSNRGTQGVNFVLDGQPSFVQNQAIGAGYFRVLGVPPLLGREFTDEEARSGGPAVAVLSSAFWKRVFSGRPDAWGQTILLRGEPFTVIGVMRAMFQGLSDADVWTRLRKLGRGGNYFALARLHEGVTYDVANGELASLGAEPFTMLRPPAAGVTRSLVVQDLHRVLADNAREPIEMLGWAVATVLLIACVNIAALLLARGGTRAKEIATRMALGSGRTAVVRQLMVESAVLAVAGGILGVLVSFAGLEGLKTIGGTTFSEWENVGLNGRTVALTLGLAALTSVVFGLLPAWQASRIDIQRALVEGGSRSIAGGSRHFGRRVLVLAEVALGVVMLVAGGLLMRQFASLRSIDPGFSPARLYTASASLQDARYRDTAAVNRLFDTSLEQLQRTPGIEAASVSQRLPYERLLNLGFKVEGRPDDKDSAIADVAYVTPSFFETFGIPVTQGRALDDRDRGAAPLVIVVNQLFADIYFPGESAVGRRLVFGRDTALEIVGVTRNVQQAGVGFQLTAMHKGPILASPTIYMPAAQAEAGMFNWFSPVWTVRAGSASAAAEAIQHAIHSVDPQLPLSEIRSMTDVMSRSMAAPRLMMTLVGTLALASLLLAAIGIHGLITQIVSERTREFGIRLALGASATQIVRDVAASGVVLSAAGAAIGIGLSFPAARLVETFLTELTARDMPTYLSVAAALILVALISSALPALRVARLDPAKTLRD
jgi:predicted permease